MTNAAAKDKISVELAAIRRDLDYLKEHKADIDCIMTEDDFTVLAEYRKAKEQGKLHSHGEVKKLLGL